MKIGSLVLPNGAADRSAVEAGWHVACVGAGGPP